MNIASESILAELPITEIEATIQSHAAPLMAMAPDKRMKKVLKNMLLGILGGQTPVITGMARQSGKAEGETLWILGADDETLNRQWVLITNIPLTSVAAVQQVYNDWRLRSRIEHGYRFDQEQGLDVEDMRVQTVERMARLFAMVLMAAQIVFVIAEQGPPKAVLWL